MTRLSTKYNAQANTWDIVIYHQGENQNRQATITVSHEAFCGMVNQLVWSGLTKTDTECVCDVADDDQWEPEEAMEGTDYE